jgi:Ni,Fe-hydrogenase III small subunit
MPAKKAKDQACAKCGGAMTDGYLVRPWVGAPGTPVELWAPGRPPVPADFSISVKKTSRSRWLIVQTLRCTGCGFLESYAH